MKLLVYNIAYGTGSPGSPLQAIAGAANYLRAPDRYFKAIAHLVRHYQPDVAGFLETDNGSFRTGGTSQVAGLAEMLKTPLNGPFFSKYSPDSYLAKLPYCRHQTNALFVRNGAADDEWVDFMPCGSKRLILGCKYMGVNIILVHLALSAQVRKKQLEYLAEITSGNGNFIICGDFNTFKGSGELNDFMQKSNLQNANVLHNPTFPARNPAKELDYILYSPNIKLKNFQIKQFPGSDHLPLMAEFSF